MEPHLVVSQFDILVAYIQGSQTHPCTHIVRFPLNTGSNMLSIFSTRPNWVLACNPSTGIDGISTTKKLKLRVCVFTVELSVTLPTGITLWFHMMSVLDRFSFCRLPHGCKRSRMWRASHKLPLLPWCQRIQVTSAAFNYRCYTTYNSLFCQRHETTSVQPLYCRMAQRWKPHTLVTLVHWLAHLL